MPALLFVWGVLAGCTEGSSSRRDGGGSPETVRLVFKQQPLGGDMRPFEALLDEFRRENPTVRLETQALPNASDVAHQFYLTALEGRTTDFDVLVADVIWVPEFARAGWIADLSEWFPPETLARDFLAGPVEAAVGEGKTWAVPWYVDVGLLFYRTDLVPRAPRTYAELQTFAEAARARRPGLQGYVWQGRQYEGLSCNVFEALWGHGGEALGRDGRVRLHTPEAVAALGYLRGLLTSGISPAWVTSAAEEESRRAFQEGRAVFMRNWPYAWSEAQSEGSPIRGRVAAVPLPTLSGAPGSGTLGGWQLAVNAHVPRERQERAARFIAHLTSLRANRAMAIHYARNPARRDAYDDAELKARAPFIASLLPAVERARPRPVTPYYNLLADLMQGEFSAAIAGLRSPEEALQRAQTQVDRVTGEGR